MDLLIILFILQSQFTIPLWVWVLAWFRFLVRCGSFVVSFGLNQVVNRKGVI